MTPKHKIFLIGFSGSGKTSTGKLLARKLKIPFVDTDQIIEKTLGMATSDIFDRLGEPVFRRTERDLIAELAGNDEGCVVSLGGGAFQSAANRKIVSAVGTVIYLRCSVQIIYQRLKDNSDRPLLLTESRGLTLRQAMIDQITCMLSQRKRNYEKADMTISTSQRTPAQVVSEIIGQMRKR
ncbi:MAG: shikimate kinase [candidate division Zixibacteria bacterium]|nr:shikimate kinase [candidate division Zixibacteria bacterium]